MNHLIAILVQFLLGERFRKIVTNFLAKTLKKVLKGPRKRRKQKGRDRGRKENKKMATTTIHEIQKEFLNRIQDPENALLTVEGIMYDLSLDEGGLRDTADETSYCGITEESLAEFKAYDPTVTINSVREVTTLTTEAAANLITRFYMWYFQKPPKQNFFALPKLLWNIVCNASLLAPYPVIIRIQQLVGDPNPDGIWGSGTNKRIEQYFEGKTVDEIMQFALAFTQSIEARYRELGQNPEFADTADAWVERAYRKYNHIKTYVEDTQAAQAAAQQAVVGSPTPEQVSRHRSKLCSRHPQQRFSRHRSKLCSPRLKSQHGTRLKSQQRFSPRPQQRFRPRLSKRFRPRLSKRFRFSRMECSLRRRT